MTFWLRAFLAIPLALAASVANAEGIVKASFEASVDRYGHFALGRPHEYARLVAITASGQRRVFELPEHEVFEDLTPRIVRLAASEPVEILAIVSHRNQGSRLVLLRLNGGHIEVSAQSAPIGTPMRWLNPVAVADLDGDGQAEIAAVITPHIGGILKIYQKQGAALVEVAALGGFSNHALGSMELALSQAFEMGGKVRLLVPDTTRTELRVVGFENRRLVEQGRCTLPTAITGGIQAVSSTQVSVGLRSGPQTISPKDCLRQ
ncbi:MAG: VCBS repeat-containing protein [Acidovorax sp.]|nr:VCBS repeat-containing protein [Acidovorax sp.]